MELNNDWVNINLGKSALLKARIGWQGLTTAEYLNSGDYFLVTGTDFLNGYIDWKNCVYVEKERYDQDKYIQLQVDDILVTKDGTIGKVAIIDRIIKPTTLNSGVFVVRPIKNSFYPKYLFYILRSGHFSDFLSKLTAGSTINHLYQKDFIYYTFPAPPTLEEQKQIANTLSDTDQLIQNLKTLIAKKKAIKQGAMQELLTGKKRLQGFTEEWETKKLGEVAKIIMGQSPLSEFYNYEGVGLPLIQGNADIKNRKTIIRTYTSFYSKQAEKGDMIMTVRAPVGEIAKASFNCSIGRGVCAIKYSNGYLFYYLMFKENSWSQLSTGSTFDSINSIQLKSFEIKLPKNIQEQQAIAQILSDMDAEIEALAQQLQKTQTLKQGMMQELLTGKTRLVATTSSVTKETTEPLIMVAEPEAIYKRK
ncbi:MAG: restriction endonuclease subunit S [Flavobacteriales bacterium]|nr:restriction endonuclease subunit S [Flavobacteriales bacterium]